VCDFFTLKYLSICFENFHHIQKKIQLNFIFLKIKTIFLKKNYKTLFRETLFRAKHFPAQNTFPDKTLSRTKHFPGQNVILSVTSLKIYDFFIECLSVFVKRNTNILKDFFTPILFVTLCVIFSL